MGIEPASDRDAPGVAGVDVDESGFDPAELTDLPESRLIFDDLDS